MIFTKNASALSFCTILIAIVVWYKVCRRKNEDDKDMKSFLHYFVNPTQTENRVTKIIFLWTPIQGKYEEWWWAIGPEPIIEDCDDQHIDGKCLITTHVDLLEKADVVLFSIQDIKQVSESTHTPMHILISINALLRCTSCSVKITILPLFYWYSTKALKQQI